MNTNEASRENRIDIIVFDFLADALDVDSNE